MANFSFRLPDIGEGIAEAEIVAWHVKVGDQVVEDQGIADVMTDKATVEMESPVSGRIVELAGAEGDIIPIGTILAVIETDEDEVPADVAEAQVPPPVEESTDSKVTTEQKDAPVKAAPPEAASVPSSAPESEPEAAAVAKDAAGDRKPAGSQPLASPAVRKRAAQLGIDLSDVKSGEGLIRHSDLDAYLRYGAAQGYAPPGPSRKRPDVEVKVIGMRRRIAENMAASKRNIPHFTYVEEMDVTALEALRQQLNETRGDRPKLTVLPMIIVAICRALDGFPMLNATYDDEKGVVTHHGAVHLGMAAQTEKGLVVPVIRNAQDMNIWQLATEIGRLSEAARTGKATSAELSGGTLTLTSLGPLGGIATTPVINRPEVAIIGPNRIVERPAVIDGEIEIRKQMNLSISCDHRVVDGHDAASYVQALKKLIEAPVQLFAI
jgi:2-oxoisovalerate dehydrogenase E2 component (dihydrolipoyl transacylase)|tara:strand:- start:134850 stop:136160 length:1311 start_codon:yes stop_codon:yes gene_type:complete